MLVNKSQVRNKRLKTQPENVCTAESWSLCTAKILKLYFWNFEPVKSIFKNNKDLTHNPNRQYCSEFQLGGLCFRTSLVYVRQKQNKSSLSFSWTIQHHRSCHCSFEFWQQMGQRFLSPDARLSACCRAQTPTESLCREQPSCRLCYLSKTIFTEQRFSYLAEI